MLEIQKRYLDEMRKKRKSMSSEVLGMQTLRTYLEKTGKDLFRLKLRDAQDFQSYLMMLTNESSKIIYSKSTVANIMAVMRNFYNWLKIESLAYSNPFMDVKKVKRSKVLPKDVLDEEALSRLLTRFREFWKGKNIVEKRHLYRAHVVSELIYSTGMTIGEVMELKPDDIDFERGLVHVRGKLENKRECVLNEYAGKVLRIYIEKMREAIFTGPNYVHGSHLLFGAKQFLRTWFNALMLSEGASMELGKLSGRSLRHALALHLIRGGCDIRFVQEVLGHKKLASTEIYIRLDKENLRAVIDQYHPRNMERKP